VKALIRGFGLAVLAVAFLGLSGCGSDNDSAANQLQGAQGPAPTPENAKAGDVAPQANNMDQYVQQQKQGNSDPSKTEYGKQNKRK